jgi:poly(3-hydroxybutyrate) depolymerase
MAGGGGSAGSAGGGGLSGAAGASSGAAGSAGSGGDGAGGFAGTAGAAGTAGTAGVSGAAGSGGMTGSESDGCGTETARPNPNQQQTMQIQGTTRYYLIHVPENYDPSEPLALVFAFHGLDMNNWWAAHDQSGFRLIEATENQAILVYPQGSGDEPGTTSRWGNISSSWNAGGQDLEFVDTLIEETLGNYCVDTDRVFATGFSMGGMMTNELGCQRPEIFRGIAPVAGWGPGSSPAGSSANCQDADAKPAALLTHGTTDGVIGINTGRASRDFWRGRDGCEENSMPGLNNCILYQGCDTGLAVGYCEHGGDHMVPSSTGENVWEFFSSLP